MTTTAHALSASIHHLFDVPFDFATETVESYLVRMEDADGQEIDRNAISEDDVDFIKSEFATDLAATNTGDDF